MISTEYLRDTNYIQQEFELNKLHNRLQNKLCF